MAPAIAADGTLTYTTAADANGSATVTVTLMDDGSTANGGIDTSTTETFTINVTSVNDPISEFGDDLSGDDRSNSLTGRGGNDTISGGGGDDFLVGNAGADTLTGGAGNDRFLYLSPTDGNDIIEDFQIGENQILIVGALFPGGLSGGVLPESQFFEGPAATTDSHRFGYNPSNGQILFDRDGVGDADNPQVLGTLTDAPEFSRTDIRVL